jgi:hypothetical protein
MSTSNVPNTPYRNYLVEEIDESEPASGGNGLTIAIVVVALLVAGGIATMISLL